MKFFDIGQEASGFIAIGQFATGFLAIGQMATGVIAIGQVARGVVAIGMVSIGLVTVGMLSASVFHTTAMLGIGGAGGKGIVFPTMPYPLQKILDRKEPREVFEGRAAGFLVGDLTMGPDRVPRLAIDGAVTPAVVKLELTDAARTRAASGEPKVAAWVEPKHDGSFVITRLMAVPAMATATTGRAVLQSIALGLLVLTCAAFYEFVAIPVLELLIASK